MDGQEIIFFAGTAVADATTAGAKLAQLYDFIKQ